jgi:glycerol-3-phosphate cytidylyltransferase
MKKEFTSVITTGVDWFRFRQPGIRIGLALGVFDFCHQGHINVISRAASACDLLVVGVHTDENVIAYKNVCPANSQIERRLAIEQLGIADKVVIFTDRKEICKKFNIDVVFHGDDWDPQKYREQWGEELIKELKLDIELLPHTPGVTSTAMRENTPPAGWWLHSSNPAWNRKHIFDHMKDLYREIGGVWFVSRTGRDLVREHFPDAPCVLVEEWLSTAEASSALNDYKLKVLVTVTFDYEKMRPVLNSLDTPINLVILSHGRSGKKGTSAEAFKKLAAGGKPVVDKALTIHDWSYDNASYTHLDDFLNSGGSLTNPVPDNKLPKVLILSTWKVGEKGSGLLQDSSWTDSLAELAKTCELVLAPHPLSNSKVVNRFLKRTGATLLETAGRSFVVVPKANCVICDLSGVFWESMLFDTPVILAGDNHDWPDDLHPSMAKTRSQVPFVNHRNLVDNVTKLLGKRVPEQNSLAVERLGTVDGNATSNVVKRIRALL